MNKPTLKNTNTKAFNDNLKAYLKSIIEDRAEGMETEIEGNPYAWILAVAKSEVSHEFERKGDQSGLDYWLSGLGMNIDYTYCEIIKQAEKLHECTLTDKQAEMVCEKWFSFIAAKILQYARS